MAVADEEFGFTGAKELLRRGTRADLAVVGEPTRLAVVNAHKGLVRWRLTTYGRAAHSAYPEDGENAVYAMADIIVSLRRYAG